jgi:dolichol-phosphate mannosyltransferase
MGISGKICDTPTLTLPRERGRETGPSTGLTISCRCPLGTVNLARPNDEPVISAPWPWVTPSSLSIVLPAYNEELNIEGAIEDACEVAAWASPAWEVIVVDDGSRDTTAQRVTRIIKSQPRVRLISFPENRGYGAALRAGFHAARGDLIFYTDSDRQFDLSELRYFLPVMDRTDVAIGFRVYRYDPVLRCLLSWVYNRLVSAVFRARVRDVDCSFKLFRREVLEAIDLETHDFFIDTEMVAKVRKWNFRILQKGVKHFPRRAGESSVRASHIPRTLLVVARMWLRMYLPVLVGRRERIEPACPRRLAGEDIARQQNPRLATAPDQDLRDEPREAHGGE